ncbi:MAG: formate dehydrogenase subunit gamma [Desulfobulbaceae bacterium]
MKRFIIVLICGCFLGTGVAVGFSGTGPQIISSLAPVSTTEVYKSITAVLSGDWQLYGEKFTLWQATLFGKLYLWAIILIPAVFLLHYLVIGPKHFSHEGQQILFFGLFCRLIHWIAAVSFTLLVITGLMIIFGNFLGGGALVRTGRSVHIVSALVMAIVAVPMLLIWIKDMLPAPHDIMWMLIMGGYLSKAKKPVPAGKFNAGQKTWFWLATAGSGVMAWSGYILYAFREQADQLRLMAVIHNFLGVALVVFFIIHLYMATLAIRGALASMITGYKPREEVEILHSRYKIPTA